MKGFQQKNKLPDRSQDGGDILGFASTKSMGQKVRERNPRFHQEMTKSLAFGRYFLVMKS